MLLLLLLLLVPSSFSVVSSSSLGKTFAARQLNITSYITFCFFFVSFFCLVSFCVAAGSCFRIIEIAPHSDLGPHSRQNTPFGLARARIGKKALQHLVSAPVSFAIRSQCRPIPNRNANAISARQHFTRHLLCFAW